jgi:hypothetical protein
MQLNRVHKHVDFDRSNFGAVLHTITQCFQFLSLKVKNFQTSDIFVMFSGLRSFKNRHMRPPDKSNWPSLFCTLTEDRED